MNIYFLLFLAFMISAYFILNKMKYKENMAVISENPDTITNTSYPHLITKNGKDYVRFKTNKFAKNDYIDVDKVLRHYGLKKGGPERKTYTITMNTSTEITFVTSDKNATFQILNHIKSTIGKTKYGDQQNGRFLTIMFINFIIGHIYYHQYQDNI